jgi:hypothetical protein
VRAPTGIDVYCVQLENSRVPLGFVFPYRLKPSRGVNCKIWLKIAVSGETPTNQFTPLRYRLWKLMQSVILPHKWQAICPTT